VPYSNKTADTDIAGNTGDTRTATCNAGTTASLIFDEDANFGDTDIAAGAQVPGNENAVYCTYTLCPDAMTYGPYLPDMEAGDYECRFQLKTDAKHVGSREDNIVKLQAVCDGCNNGEILGTRSLARHHFNMNQVQQTFVLPFTKGDQGGEISCVVSLLNDLEDKWVTHGSTQIVGSPPDQDNPKEVTLTCGADAQFAGNKCAPVQCTTRNFGNAAQDLNGVYGGHTFNVTCNDGHEGGDGWSCGPGGSFISGNGCTPCSSGTWSTGGAACQPHTLCGVEKGNVGKSYISPGYCFNCTNSTYSPPGQTADGCLPWASCAANETLVSATARTQEPAK
jgi:hypothetical protein